MTCITGSYLICYSIPDWDQNRALALFIGTSIGVLVILIDVFLKGFSLRGRDEFNLVIPYVRFEPHGVDVPLVVLDTSVLIDGRIIGICESRFMGYALVIPHLVLDELQHIADSSDVQRQTKGRKGWKF